MMASPYDRLPPDAAAACLELMREAGANERACSLASRSREEAAWGAWCFLVGSLRCLAELDAADVDDLMPHELVKHATRIEGNDK